MLWLIYKFAEFFYYIGHVVNSNILRLRCGGLPMLLKITADCFSDTASCYTGFLGGGGGKFFY